MRISGPADGCRKNRCRNPRRIREYSTLPGLLLLLLLLLSAGCSSVPSGSGSFFGAEPSGNPETRRSLESLSFSYWTSPDPAGTDLPETLVLLPGFPLLLADRPWDGGETCLLMVLTYLGLENLPDAPSLTPEELALRLKTQTDRDSPGALPGSADNYYEFGTGLPEMAAYVESRLDCRTGDTGYRTSFDGRDLIPPGTPWFSEADGGNLYPVFSQWAEGYPGTLPGHSPAGGEAVRPPFLTWLRSCLERNLPVLVKWADGGGRWTVIIGWDGRGTEDPRDDVLIFADPLDEYDGNREGCSAFPLSRWFALWQDRQNTPRPWQLQPFLVILPGPEDRTSR